MNPDAVHEAACARLTMKNGGAVVRGRVPVHEVNRELGVELPEGPGWVTLAGLAISLAGAIPKEGTRLAAGRGVTLEILEASSRRVSTIRVLARTPEDDTRTPEWETNDE